MPIQLLVAVDLHDRARDVVTEVVRWAAATHAVVDLVYVDAYRYTAQLLPDPQVRLVVEHQWDAIRDANLAALQELLLELPVSCRGEARYLAGIPADEIVNAAAEYDAVVVGTHGRTGLGHVLLGSVAERVVRRAPCPVLTLRLGASGAGS